MMRAPPTGNADATRQRGWGELETPQTRRREKDGRKDCEPITRYTMVGASWREPPNGGEVATRPERGGGGGLWMALSLSDAGVA